MNCEHPPTTLSSHVNAWRHAEQKKYASGMNEFENENENEVEREAPLTFCMLTRDPVVG
jgi:hypothetical protein